MSGLGRFVRSYLSTQFGSSEDLDWWTDKFESVVMTYCWSQKCETAGDYLLLVQTAYKLLTGKSANLALAQYMDRTFGHLQSDSTSELLTAFRAAFDFVDGVAENPLVKKVTSLYSYLLVQGFLARFGMELNDEDYSRIEQRAMREKFSSKKGLWMNILDTTLFVCERVHEWKKTGEVSSFLHSGGDYEKWSQQADKLLALAPFTANLEAHGTTYFTFVADLNDTVERGEAYAKFTSKMFGDQVVAIKRKLMALQLLKNTEITKRASQKERKAPFGVLIHGSSSVAKSTFSKMLYYYYGKLHGLETDDHYRYVRSPTDEYWSNFDSSKWCIQLDDIAFLHPDKSSDVDPTLKEMLNVVNNVPYVPPQAAIEDKGKTPVMARLVVATTNAKDLNARDYFWCPLAVRRRLPFVVHVEPKEEYLASNRKFIDPSRLAPIDGAFPDFWRITLQKVVPYFDGQRDMAVLEDVKVYENSAEFLRDFGQTSRDHEETQVRAMTCDVTMQELQVCGKCMLVQTQCACPQLQAMEVPDWEFPDWHVVETVRLAWWTKLLTWCTMWCTSVFSWCVEIKMMMWIWGWALQYEMLRRLFRRFVLPCVSDAVQIRLVGYVNGELLGTKRWKLALGALVVVATAVAIYTKTKKKSCEQQGNVYSTTETQLEKEESRNVWYNPTLELSKFDLPPAALSLAGATPEKVESWFAANCVQVTIRYQKNGENRVRTNCAVLLKGHLCMINNHAMLKGVGIYHVTIVKALVADGVTPNMSFILHEEDLVRNDEIDMCVFETRSLPAAKDITKFWDIGSARMFTRAVVLRRLETGHLERQEIYNLQYDAQMNLEGLEKPIPVSMGTAPRTTMKGDCGAIAVAITPRGPVIYGLHIAGYNKTCVNVCVTKADVEAMCAQIAQKSGTCAVVQGGGEPMLDLHMKKSVVTEPHHKSIVRYLPEGNANVYGSFAGFKPAPKSKVCATPLQGVMEEHFAYKCGFGKPAMEGWEPWRKNVVEMVKPTVNYRRTTLDACVASFTADILRELPAGWEKELMFLSRRASVNGLPGVKFIDKMNTNTSMGFPWAETKKRHLIADVTEDYPEGVTFTEEVWERVEKIEALYAEGKRCYPVFTAHLKDEPTAQAKILAKKTRVFTGAPVDWSIVVRSRLLPFIRLLQKNKFVFEAGPGTVCQSMEWTKVHTYLTAFGENRIIAGDYGKFDKRMIADFILAAYKIIGDVYKAAGFSDEEVREIACIGEDTAFPLVNMNGDLMEFFGTNPSGHPLTVIVNSLVNSLYMRYCYVQLNPDRECCSFKENVHLFTYGDDNIMGVKQGIDWFNHTGIQAELAAIGVEYTMADKESASVPFVNIRDVQFLKRSWRFDEDVGAFLCPLELTSIHKSLTAWVPSSSIDEYAQMVAVISSANSEFFFYGRETFERHHAFFRGILEAEPYASYVNASTLPTWAELVERFHRAGASQ
jgi:hypothetical protein